MFPFDWTKNTAVGGRPGEADTIDGQDLLEVNPICFKNPLGWAVALGRVETLLVDLHFLLVDHEDPTDALYTVETNRVEHVVLDLPEEEVFFRGVEVVLVVALQTTLPSLLMTRRSVENASEMWLATGLIPSFLSNIFV